MNAVFLYDGDCGFCSACARFVGRWIPNVARVVPWQETDLLALGVSRRECMDAVQWIASGVRPLAGPAAIAALLRTSTVPWRWLGRALGWGPVLAAAWPLYRWVSRQRHRLPGSTSSCDVT